MMKRHRFILIFSLLLLAACTSGENKTPELEDPADTISLTSAAFSDGEAIPARYSCDGDDLSPSLDWAAPPAGTQSFALILDDPDAPSGDWVHWVLYNIPAGSRALKENISPDASLPDGSLHGKNSWKAYGYGGPCPPSGTHRYFFKLFALDTVLEVEDGMTRQDLLNAMQGHILATGQLAGKFTR